MALLDLIHQSCDLIYHWGHTHVLLSVNRIIKHHKIQMQHKYRGYKTSNQFVQFCIRLQIVKKITHPKSDPSQR